MITALVTGACKGMGCIALFLVAAAALAYEGDGSFADLGPQAAGARYVVDLGPVELGRPWRREYALADLPEEDFVIAIRVDPAALGREPPRATVRLRLVNERGETVVDATDSLANWDLATEPGQVLVFLRGQRRLVPVGPRASKYVRLGSGPDGGWGSHFTPRRAGRYRLAFETVAPQQDGAIEATLVALGGGGNW
jgi:hypothetical protein